MAFTRTWNAAYEGVPADTDDASEGAQRIRHLKADISERLDVDHSWEGDGDDGKHKQITLLEQAAAPTNDTDTGFLYTKDVSGATELFYEDDSGNEVQLTDGGEINKSFPAGTRMLFYQAAAPTYWTQVTSVNDRMLRVVSGSGGGIGGTDSPILMDKVPSHNHYFSDNTAPGGEHRHGANSGNFMTDAGGVYSFGSGGVGDPQSLTDWSDSHSHPVSGYTNNNSDADNWEPRYADVIVAEKD